LVFDALHFSYGSQSILRGVFIKISPGSICAVTGRNGSGKSTLMKIGVGELKPFSGNIYIDGECVTAQKGAKRFRHIAYLSQKSFLPRELSVLNLLKKCNSVKSLLKDEILEPLLLQKIADLSGGEKRYLELRLILSLDRHYYLLDEPFTGSAPVLIERMIDIIRQKKNEDAGILLTDHYSRYVARVIDEQYFLIDGYSYKQKCPVSHGASLTR